MGTCIGQATVFLVVLCCSLNCSVCSYFVLYPCFLPLGIVGVVFPVVTQPGASESYAQMVAPHGGVGAMRDVTWRQSKGWAHACEPSLPASCGGGRAGRAFLSFWLPWRSHVGGWVDLPCLLAPVEVRHERAHIYLSNCIDFLCI